MTTPDPSLIARAGMIKHRAVLNAFIESAYPNTAHDHDEDEYTIAVLHGITLQLRVTPDYIEVRGKMHGAPIAPTFPAAMNPSLIERCAEVIADGLSLVSSPAMISVPAWAKAAVKREFFSRAQLFADYADSAEAMALEDALWCVEQALQRRGKVAPEQVIPALMEAGLPCQWVKDQPPSQRAYAGHSPDLRALQDAIHRAKATPYIVLDPSDLGDDDPPSTLYLGWEVISCEYRPIITALYYFLLSPGPVTFDVLMGYLQGSRMEIIGDGPVAAWCRQHLQK